MAPASVVSVLAHGAVLTALAMLFVSQRQTDELEIVVLRGADFAENSELPTETFEREAEQPSQHGFGDFTLAPESFMLSEVGMASLSLKDGVLGGGSDEGDGKSFGGRIRQAREHGLDVVLVFDSTGSMGSEIAAVKRRIDSIGTTLLEKIPLTRISLVTYRDRKDKFCVRGIPLTNDLARINRFLGQIDADGGGDTPEAVDQGLEWAVTFNRFGDLAHKVILVFGDAPPHPHRLTKCLQIANSFRRSENGSLSTITCRSSTPLPAFYRIARAGGGEAFTINDTRWFLEELLAVAFGREYREDVAEFFGLEITRAE